MRRIIVLTIVLAAALLFSCTTTTAPDGGGGLLKYAFDWAYDIAENYAMGHWGGWDAETVVIGFECVLAGDKCMLGRPLDNSYWEIFFQNDEAEFYSVEVDQNGDDQDDDDHGDDDQDDDQGDDDQDDDDQGDDDQDDDQDDDDQGDDDQDDDQGDDDFGTSNTDFNEVPAYSNDKLEEMMTFCLDGDNDFWDTTQTDPGDYWWFVEVSSDYGDWWSGVENIFRVWFFDSQSDIDDWNYWGYIIIDCDGNGTDYDILDFYRLDEGPRVVGSGYNVPLGPALSR